ncbi:hypothetical protein G4B88_027845 [Cannabis sativa]|uniref:Large ribosomal subunit protein uL4m n=1 Tax=Cannabis sativa TaxID=3483 RepID=A0A7J6I671_CANSA|nr:hypothetical protein G4B88_027845 [Cannabis sativa]
MALSISKRLLRSLGSSSAFSCCHSRFIGPSICTTDDSCNHVRGDSLLFKETSAIVKGGLSLLSYRKFSTSILTPEASEGAFPSDLLSAKPVLESDRKIGLYQDLVIPVTNFHNEDKGFMVLDGEVFDVPIRKDIIHRVVLWQLAKRQQGTHSTKTISEVSGTGRKPWRQKGTGRARHGTLRGPQLLVFEDLEVPTHKTKNIVNYVQQMENAKKFLLVDGDVIGEKLKLATQNLHYVNVLPSVGLNVYSILQHDTLVMSRAAINRIVERMNTPINR